MIKLNRKLIDDILAEKDVRSHVYAIMIEWGERDEDAVPAMLHWISAVANIQLKKARDQSQRRLKGIEDLIHLTGSKRIPAEQFVIMTWQAMMEYFPQGEASGASEIGKRVFLKFVNNLHECKNRLIDSYWAITICPCNDYLKKVLELHPIPIEN